MVEKGKIIEESQILYSEIDSCIIELLGARTTHNSEEEGKALFRMEGLMVGVLQHLSCIIDSLPEQPVEGLEETADLLAIAHLQGMEQQRAKMMEEAVEGEIQMRYSGCLCAKTIRTINEDKFKLGDKVRIIIVKEDEK